MTLLLPAVAALSAILFLPWWSFYFDVVPKIIVILMGAAAVFFMRFDWPATGPRVSNPVRNFAWIAAAQALTTIMAAIFSTHPQLSWLGGTWRRSGAIAEVAVLILAVAAAAHLATHGPRLQVFLRITVLASIPISMYGIAQYFGMDPWLTSSGYHFGEGVYMIVRPPATLGHAAYFATYSLYAAFGGAALFNMESKSAWRVATAAAMVLAIFGMVLSGTRAALAGLAIGAVFVFLRDRPNRRLLYAMAGLAIVLGGFYISPAGGKLRARAFWASEDKLGGSRLLLWRDSLRMGLAPRALMAGYGPDSFALEFPKHQSIELARAYPDFYHESPHNIFLDALDSKGIAGLAALIALVIFVLIRARGLMGGAFVAMLVSQQFTTFTLATELYFYLTAAMIVSDFIKPLPVVAARSGAGAVSEPSGIVSIRPRWWSVALALPFAALAIYIATGDALLATARRALDRNYPDRAAQFEDRARRWRMTADVYFSRRFLTQGTTDPKERFRALQYAMTAASRAPETADDRQNALINLAAIQASVNDASGVERSLRAAIAAAPMFYKSHWLLAEVLAFEGRTDEAREEARAAADRDGGKHSEIQATLHRLGSR